MATYKVRLYKQTGYNMTDVPDSNTTLDKNTKEDCEVIFEWQSRILPSIIVPPTTSFKIEDCDYARITRSDNADGDMCYFVGRGIDYLAEGTVLLPLIFDSVGTCLINSVLKDSIVGGRVARRHTNEENMIPEPFTQTRPLVKTNTEIDIASVDMGGGLIWTPYMPLLISSTNLANLVSQGADLPAGKFVDSSGEGVIVPALVSPSQSTELLIATKDSSGSPQIDETYLYAKRPLPQKLLYWGDVYNTTDSAYVKNGNNIAQLLRGLGLDSIITAAYSFPSELYDEAGSVSGTDPKSFSKFKTKAKVKPFPFNVMNDAVINGVTIRNKKTRYLFRKFILQSVASQNSQMYEAWELMLTLGVDTKATNNLVAIADPSPQGTVYVRPTFLRNSQSDTRLPAGNYIDGFYRAVPSTPWNAYTLAAEGGEVLMANANYAIQTQQLLTQREAMTANQAIQKKQYAIDLITGAMQNNAGYNMLSNIPTAASGAMGAGAYGGVAGHMNPIAQATMGTGFNTRTITKSQFVPGTSGGMDNPLALASATSAVAMNSLNAGFAAAGYDSLYGSGAMQQQLLANQRAERANLTAREQSINLAQMSAYMQPPTFTSEAPVGVSSAFITRYQMTVQDLDPQDLMLLDLQLTMEGYQVNEGYNSKDTDQFARVFNSRTKYNYASFDMVHINTPYNGDISADVSARLKAGVRVWHDKVSLGAYYEANPIR